MNTEAERAEDRNHRSYEPVLWLYLQRFCGDEN